ncbi:MAG: glycosyltransferase family 2 protein [Candidatus Woesebacteria bacterium]
MLSSLSAFFPCYNEEENLQKLVDSSCTFLPTIAKKYEIIVVDDGSQDNTQTVIADLQKECQELRLVSHAQNAGYGAALKTGIHSAKMDWVFWMDGDLQFNIESLETFLPYAEKYDAIIGFRAHRADTFLRKVNGELYTRLINFLFGTDVLDIDCAFKLIRRECLEKISIDTSSAFTSAEILIKLKRSGVKIKQVSVPHFKRQFGNPTGGSLRVIFKGLKETLTFFIQHRV